jgi:hypothetical protein
MASPLIFTSAVRQDLYRSDTPTTAGQQAENTRLTVSLSEFASGRKSEAPAPAAQQDKTAGRTELPHHPLKITSLRSFPP